MKAVTLVSPVSLTKTTEIVSIMLFLMLLRFPMLKYTTDVEAPPEFEYSDINIQTTGTHAVNKQSLKICSFY